MKKLVLLSIASVMAMSISPVANAQQAVTPSPASVGVQFPAYYGGEYSVLNSTNVNGNTNQYGYQAGAYNQQDWNVASASTGNGPGVIAGPITNLSLTHDSNGTVTAAPGTLQDSSGNTSDVIFALTNATVDDHTAASSTNFPASIWYAQNGATPFYLVNGVVASQSAATPVTLALTGLNDSDYYNLYAYVGSLWYYGSVAGTATLGTTSISYSTDGGSLSNYTAATGAGTVADYVEFTNVLGSDLSAESLTINGAGTGLSGFQLVDIGATAAAVPEPSTIWAFSLGFLGLMVHVYRKRQARA